MNRTYEDAFNLLCGRKIGDGMTRTVFECNVRSDFVVKVEDDEPRSHFQNLMEWFVWKRVCGTHYEKWFAPVVEISPDGRLLLMKKTRPMGEPPTKMPTFFTDFKTSNYGLYEGRIVCHDYGTTLLMEVGMSKRMKSVRWSDLQES